MNELSADQVRAMGAALGLPMTPDDASEVTHRLNALLEALAVDRDVAGAARSEEVRAAGAAEPHHPLVALLVVVAVDGVHGRDLTKGVENMRAADVAGVDDGVDAADRRLDTGIDVAVSVGNDADKHAVS